MKKLNFYSFHRNIQTHRFDHNNTISLIESLSNDFEVVHYDYDGSDNFIFHDVHINHGSILIFEYDDTKLFKVYDFGDHPGLTVKLSKLTNFAGAVIGQYNSKYWDSIISDSKIRKTIVAGIYPESVWQLGVLNYEQICDTRNQIKLDSRLYWRGSLYNHGVPENYLGIRKSIELLPTILSETELFYGNYPIPFIEYISEAVSFKLALSIGGGGGAFCGDFCFRDIEMFALGIPLIRPKYIVEAADPLIPDYHYISVDTEFDNDYRYKNHEKLAHDISETYKRVINDDSLLQTISNNAHEWYLRNLSYPNITNHIIRLLSL